MHGPDQRHNTDESKVIKAEVEKLKARKPAYNVNNQQGGAPKPNSTDKKRPAANYSTEQLKDVVRMTRKKAMTDVKAQYNSMLQEELHAIEIHSNASQEKEKMNIMELFINNPEEDFVNETEELTQAEIDELTAASLSERSPESESISSSIHDTLITFDLYKQTITK
jgi:hypothetical protein